MPGEKVGKMQRKAVPRSQVKAAIVAVVESKWKSSIAFQSQHAALRFTTAPLQLQFWRPRQLHSMHLTLFKSTTTLVGKTDQS